MKNIIVGQSGGPTAVINASLYGVITEGKRYPDLVGCVYGMHNGIEGFLKDDYENLSETLSDSDLELLKHTDRKSTRLNSSHSQQSRMPSSA